MKTNIKKTLKLIILLISSLLIATASATVYRYMELQGTIIVGSPKLVWIEGSGIDTTIIGNTTAIISLNVENNTAINFTQAIFLKNVNDTVSFNYNITVTSALSTSQFEEAKIHIYDNSTSTYLGTINLTDSTSYFDGTLSANNSLRMTIEVKAIQEGSGNFIIQVEYWS